MKASFRRSKVIGKLSLIFAFLGMGIGLAQGAKVEGSNAPTDFYHEGGEIKPSVSLSQEEPQQEATKSSATAEPTSTQTPDLSLLGANCSSPVEFDNQWSNGYRLVCQNNLYVLMVDLTNPAIKVEVVAAGSGTRSVSSYADGNTIAMINADYQWCSSGAICSQGLTISNGSSPTTYTNISHLCSDAWVRREIGFSQDGRVTTDWWYKFVSDSQARSWCGNLPGSGGGLEQYSYNLVGGGPQITFDGSFHWTCGYGYTGTPGASDCRASGSDVIINDEHFGSSATNWWNRYQSAIAYSTDGTVLALAESNNQTHTMQAVHDILYQRLSAYGKTLKNTFKFDGGSKAGFWYYNSTYNSTPGVLVPNVIRIQRTNSTCYSLSTNINPGGAGSVNVNTSPNCAQSKYLPGTNVQLTANANSGYSFSNWSGDASGSSNPTTITLNSNKNVTANFSVIQTCYSLSTNVSPGGAGSISLSPGPNCNGTQYTSGTVVQLTANTNSGYTFSSWSGDIGGSSNPTTITMNGAKTVTANFSAIPTCYSLTTSMNPGGGGSIGLNPGPNCNGTQYTSGTTVQLTANANSGYTFNNWSGDTTGTSNPISITMNGAKSVTANFSQLTSPDLIVQSISFSPNTPSVGQAVGFTIRIKNQGTGPASSSFYLDFYIDYQPTGCQDFNSIYYWTVISLAAGATQDFTYSYPGFSTSGIHNLWAFVDSGCQIGESNNNNIQGPTAINVSTTPATYRVYLPIVTRNNLSSSIVNGNFESGSTGWVEYSAKGWGLILTADILSQVGVTPYSGNWAVWLGGDNNETAYIQQQVTVPVSSPFLSYWHWIDSDEVSCIRDFGRVIVNSNIMDQYALCSSANTGGWVKHSVNLSAYTGQSIALQIKIETDSSINSNLFVDGVSFQASAASMQSNLSVSRFENTFPKTEITHP